jgi:hypothetical protein
MNITSITPSVVHFVQTDESGWNDYIRFGEDNWMIRMGESYEIVLYTQEAKLDEAFEKAQQKGKLILQQRLKYPFADGSIRNWHDHPDMAFGSLPKLSDSLKERLSEPGGEYLYRAIRRHEEVVWEGGGE